MSDFSKFYTGDDISVSITVTDDSDLAVSSLGPVTGCLVQHGVLVGSSVILESNASGADWMNGVYVFTYPGNLSDSLDPGAYEIAIKLGDTNRTVISQGSIEIDQGVL